VRDVVELRAADGADALARFDDASWDVIFLDAERPAYVGYWPDLVRVLGRPGLLAVDNVAPTPASWSTFAPWWRPTSASCRLWCRSGRACW